MLGGTALWNFLNMVPTGSDAFGLNTVNSDENRLSLGQCQVNAINYWMDRLRNVQNAETCQGILLTIPEGWYLPELTRPTSKRGNKSLVTSS